MKKVITFCLILLCWLSSGSFARQATPQLKPEQIVEEWFVRWNGLDGSEAKTQRFLELYQANASHQTGPSSRQIGPVYLEAPEGIRKLAEDFSRANTEVAFHIETVTANEKSVELYYVTDGPWKGPAVAVQFVGAYTVRETKKRYTYPGAAFFYIENGKIRHARFYSSRDELAEVRP